MKKYLYYHEIMQDSEIQKWAKEQDEKYLEFLKTIELNSNNDFEADFEFNYEEERKAHYQTKGMLTDAKSELRKRAKQITEFKKALSVFERTKAKDRELYFKATEMNGGYIPPQNVKLEEIILGSYIKNKTLMKSYSQPYLNLMWYKEEHKIIHMTLMNMEKRVTQQTVVSELRKKEQLEVIGGPYYIDECLKSEELTNDADTIRMYIDELEHHYLAREAIEFANNLSRKMFTDQGKIESMPEELREQSLKILELLPFRFRKTYDRRSALIQVKEDFKELQKRKGQPRISTGYSSLDRVTHGILPNKLFINGGRGKQGKTTFTSCIADNVANQGYHVAYFSHELTIEQIIQKLAARRAKVDIEKFEYYKKNFTKAEKRRIEKAFEEIDELPFLIEGGRPNNLSYIVNRSKQLKASHPDLSLIVFDGLQAYEHLVPERGNKSDFFYKVLSTMKYEIAEPLGVTVWLNAQLKAQVEKYKNKKPRSVDDFSDCKGIPEVADGAFLLYRPEAYFDGEEYSGWMNVHPIELRSAGKKGKQFNLGAKIKYADIYNK